MAIGQIVIIQSNQGTQVRIPSGNYLYPTIRVLNPNDGIVYVKENAGITNIGYGAWDYKIPSQSFGVLPAESQGWQNVGLWYTDQSGTNRPAEVTVYLSQQKLQEPAFVAIGRALIQQSTTVDIVQGSQPGNPGAGITRLWCDTLGHLNILQSNGTSYTVLDSNNASTYITPIVNNAALGADLFGTVSAGHISIAYGSAIYMRDSTGGSHTAIAYASTGNQPIMGLYSAGGGIWILNAAGNAWQHQFQDNGNFLHTGNGTVNGNFAVSGAGTVTGGLDVGSINTKGGVAYFIDATHYIQWASPWWTLAGGNGLLISANTLGLAGGAAQLGWSGTWVSFNVPIISGGAVYMFGTTGAGFTAWDGTWLTTPNHIIVQGNVRISQQFAAYGSYNGSNFNAFLCANANNYTGQGLAFSWNTWSSLDHATQYSLRIDPVTDPLSIVNAISGYSYDHASIDAEGNPIRTEEGVIQTAPTYGFRPSEVAEYLPELVDENKEHLDMMRMVVVLWEAVKELDARTRPANIAA